MEDIKFIYPARPGVTVLQSFDTSVSPGKTLAFVGPSGSGKSTVISLIERFYDPTAGCVRFDGTDIRDLNISWYRHQTCSIRLSVCSIRLSVCSIRLLNIKATPQTFIKIH